MSTTSGVTRSTVDATGDVMVSAVGAAEGVADFFISERSKIGADGSLVHNGSLSTAAVASLLRASSAVWARLGMLTRTTRESRLAALVG